jgi:hypothetical protein
MVSCSTRALRLNNFSSSDSLLATVHVNLILHEADTSFSMELGLDAEKVLAHKSKTDNTQQLPALLLYCIAFSHTRRVLYIHRTF